MSYCGKHHYPSKRDAATACNALMRRGTRHEERGRARRKRPDHLHPYFCLRCHAWHITSKEPWE